MKRGASLNRTSKKSPSGSNHTFTFSAIRLLLPLSCWLPGWDDGESANPRWLINLKVPTIECENLAQPLALGNADQRRIRQIHRQIAILTHQLLHAWNVIDAYGQDLHGSGFHHVPQCLLRPPRKTQQMHRFRKHGPHGAERLVHGRKGISTTFMFVIVFMYEGDKRPASTRIIAVCGLARRACHGISYRRLPKGSW